MKKFVIYLLSSKHGRLFLTSFIVYILSFVAKHSQNAIVCSVVNDLLTANRDKIIDGYINEIKNM